jgi:putative N6-adenine-specific DNA methylase
MAGPGTSYRFFASASPGLEPLLERELAALAIEGHKQQGGVEARGPIQTLWLIHRESRLAESVRVRLKEFTARTFAELEAGLARLPWHAYLRPSLPLRIDVTCHKSRLYHSDAVAERLGRVLEASLGSFRAQRADELPQKVYVRIVQDRVQPSVDASGERLHRRGYRTHVGEAPLRETLAAALAIELQSLAGPHATAVWDPFCGSGTLLIEWLRLRAGIVPGATRHFAFEQWPTHDRKAYVEWRAERRTAPVLEGLTAIGSDHDERVLEAATGNAERAHVLPACRFLGGDLREAARVVPPGTAVLTNPPYGVRLDPGKAQRALSAFESLLIERSDLRPVVMACGHPKFLARARLPWRTAFSFKSGGLTVRALVVQ